MPGCPDETRRGIAYARRRCCPSHPLHRLPVRRPADAQRRLEMANLSDFEMTSITGEKVELSQYADKLCLVVNVATK